MSLNNFLNVFKAGSREFYGALSLFSDSTYLARHPHVSAVISCLCASLSSLCGIICSQRKHRGNHRSRSTHFNQLKKIYAPSLVFSHSMPIIANFKNAKQKILCGFGELLIQP